MQDDRDLPLRRFLAQSTSYAESITDPFGDEADPFQDVPAQVASSEAGSARSFVEGSIAEASPEIAQVILFPEPQPAELQPDQNPRINHSESARQAVGSIGPGISQSSASQSSEATLMVGSLIDDEADNMSVPGEPRTVLKGEIRRDEQAIKATASRRRLLTEKQKNELDERLAGELTGSMPSIDDYYYIGKDKPKENAPDYLVAALLDLGADVNGTINTGGCFRCFLQAEMSKASPRSTVVRLLLARGASLDHFTARQLLLCAIFLCGAEGETAGTLAEVALDNGVSPSMRIEQADIDETLRSHVPTWALLRCSIVTYGACSASTEVLQLLVARGAALDQFDAQRTLFVAARLGVVKGLNLARFALANGAVPDGRIEASDISTWPAYDITFLRRTIPRTGQWWSPTHYFESQYLDGVGHYNIDRDTRRPTHYFQDRHIGWTAVKYAIECKYQLDLPAWESFYRREEWRKGLRTDKCFSNREWTFIEYFVKLLTNHGASYQAEVLSFVVDQKAGRQLDWVLPWKQSSYATAEVGPEILWSACRTLMNPSRSRRDTSVDRVAILRSIIASGAVLTDLSFTLYIDTNHPRLAAAHSVEVLQLYETERQKRLQVNRRAPGTYTDAQCRAVPGLDQRIVELEEDIRRPAEREQQEEEDLQQAQSELGRDL